MRFDQCLISVKGAHIIGDAVAGGGGVLGLGIETPPVSAAIANRGESSKLSDSKPKEDLNMRQ